MYKICKAVSVLHHNNMIHTDIKPENILLPIGFDLIHGFDNVSTYSDAPSEYPSGSEDNGIIFDPDEGNQKIPLDVRLIDFGSLSTSGKWHYMLATTRRYRAPEIMLGERWSVECDTWSLGCLLVELAIGDIPFDSRDDLEHLFLIQHMISPFPKRMRKECTVQKIKESFCGDLINPACMDEEQCARLMSRLPLVDYLGRDEDLIDLALKMLDPDPFKRPPIEEILNHRFFDALH